MRLTSSRAHRFDADRAAVWDAMTNVDAFPLWWPWLRKFDGTELRPGAIWRCVVQPPLPYALRFTVTVSEVVTGQSVTALVSGDISGEATVALEDEGEGCRAVLRSTLTPQNGLLRVVAQLAPPVARYGHDWVLDTGARQFVHRALRTPDPT